ncbi:unnamed protein product [Fraxinus pennsylvanica]|uniref:MPN domain-containing protein n=1 Tax=Fraxinus pennsylvanica TaxID=56036 RepID=A0AAD1YNV6_9LAMI|nr:unnamed protein product [Fraxinus pennsylvanica]
MMTRSSSGAIINIEASTKKLEVDNRISLRFYYRIADNILKQADIFRGEKNIVDLYFMLLRFSSLIMDTIPRHRDYRASPQIDKVYLKKKLINAISELEELKPAVQRKVQELLSRKQPGANQNNTLESSLGSPVAKQERWNNCSRTKTSPPVASEFAYRGLKTQHLSLVKPMEEHHRRISLSIPRPKDETLARHSILGPNGLRGQWQPPSSNYKVQYPSNLDLTPVQAPSCLEQPFHNSTTMRKDDGNLERERSTFESIVLPAKGNQTFQTQEPDSLISFETDESLPQEEIVTQPKPPPVLADIQDLIARSTPALETVESLPLEEIIRQPKPPPVLADVQDLVSRSTTERECGMEKSSSDGLNCSEDPLQLHISTELMDCFMKLAKSNTDKDLETCGVLAGSLRNRTFSITALIIPKQESTSNSCQTTNEEEIFEVQDKQSLFPLGWIHTHPTQSCFMSSIDVHTHYSYQVMLPESIAIVMAPRDTSKKHGIFRLTPGGMTVVRLCPQRGFHPHEPPSDGTPIYNHCTDVYMNPSLKFLLDTVLDIYSSLQEEVNIASNSSPLPDTNGNMEASELLKEKGNAAYKGKQWNKAVTYYTEAIKLNETSATYYSNRAAAYLELGCFQQAEKDCTEAIFLDKKNVKAYLRRGTARESLLFYKEALQDFKHALVLEPQNKVASMAEKRLRKLIS